MELSKTDILLTPSVVAKDGDEEGTPTALVEALAQGIPVISTWHSGIPEIVEDGAHVRAGIPTRPLDGRRAARSGGADPALSTAVESDQ